MSVYGNGFLAYHIEVRVKDGCAESVKADVKLWKQYCREHSGWPGFPSTLMQRIDRVNDVLDVRCEGPQSAVLIPLRMMHTLTGRACALSAVTGTGPISETIEADLQSWGIEFEPAKRLDNADALLEFSFRDSQGNASSLKLYPASRNRYNATIGQGQLPPHYLVLNRYNKGLMNLAARVASADGVVTFRPRELGRYDKIEDWISLLPHTRQLTISSRHGALKAFAKQENIKTPRAWPEGDVSLNDPTFIALATALAHRMPADAIVLLHRQSDAATLFFTKSRIPLLIPAPPGYGHESRMARLQGALLALTSLSEDVTKDQEAWLRLCEDTVNTAWLGTESRPWQYPSFVEAQVTV